MLEFLVIALLLAGIEAAKFSIISGGVFGFFRSRLHQRFKRLQTVRANRKAIGREIRYSSLTFLIFGLVFTLPFHSQYRSYTKIYTSIDEYGTTYFFFSAVLLFLFFDAYFYWTHRALHHFSFLKRVHTIHHLSTTPTSFATHSFHPVEAFIHSIWFLPLVFLIPLQRELLIVFQVATLLHNALAHSGFEIYPPRILKLKIFRYLSTPSFHDHHHRSPDSNFGLTFLWWDRFMKTYIESIHDQRTDKISGFPIPHPEKKPLANKMSMGYSRDE